MTTAREEYDNLRHTGRRKMDCGECPLNLMAATGGWNNGMYSMQQCVNCGTALVTMQYPVFYEKLLPFLRTWEYHSEIANIVSKEEGKIESGWHRYENNPVARGRTGLVTVYLECDGICLPDIRDRGFIGRIQICQCCTVGEELFVQNGLNIFDLVLGEKEKKKGR